MLPRLGEGLNGCTGHGTREKILERTPAGGIDGLERLELSPSRDARGSFVELYRSSWLPGIFGESSQLNCSVSLPGVLRGLHYHTDQWDAWFPVAGRIRAAMADLRTGSPTWMKTCVMELSPSDPCGILIPPGVAHGYLAIDLSVVVYLVNRFYDGTDEHGIAWDDPLLGIEWGAVSPVLSERDRKNPRLPSEWRDGGPRHD